MKKWIVIVATVLIVGLIGFVLMKNKAEIAEKAKVVPITSYPVSVVPVARENIGENISQVGVIVSNNDVAVVAEQSGKVTQVMVQEGSYVKAGAPLVRLDDLLPRTQLMSAQTSYEKAKKDWARSQSLRKQEIISDTELEGARLSYKAAEATYITAQRQCLNAVTVSPISGMVTSRPVNIGSMVNPGTVVAEVVDVSLFKVEVNVGEADAFRLKVGDTVSITSDVYPGVQFGGKINSIGVKGDAAHNYPVKVLIPNSRKNYPLKSGMYCKVDFNLPQQNALTIPRNALVGSIKEPQVFVVEGRKAHLRQIVVGTEIGTKITVMQGLNEGEEVVCNGQENIRDNATVDIVK